MNTHTSGPWQYQKASSEHQIPAFTIYDTSGETWMQSMMVGYLGHTRTPGQAEANARLIAAAPDLLAACQALVEFWDNGTPVRDGSDVANDVRTAIAKAKGGA